MRFSAIGINGDFRVWNTNKYSEVEKSFKACDNSNFLLFNYKIVKRTGPENKYFDDLVSSYFKYLEIFDDNNIAHKYCSNLCKAWESFGFNIEFPWEDVIYSLAFLYDESTKKEN